MIKSLGVIFAILGAISLVVGIFGIFGSLAIGMSPWAFAIIGIIFFAAGTGMLKQSSKS